MAIQVNGTTVIDNSRNLNNIASIDATTAAAINAGGVGGTDVQFTATANISKGQPIAINDSGQAQPVQLTTSDIYNAHSVTGFTGYTSNTGQVLHIANVSEPNLYCIMGHYNYYNYLAFVIVDDSGNFTYKGPYYMGGYSGGNYERVFDVATDGQGNWGFCYAHYHGSANTHYKRVGTFSTDSSYNVSNMSTSGILVGGDNYMFNFRVASYDTNRFCLIYKNNQTTVKNLKYYTFYRNGSSVAGLSGGNLGSTAGEASILNMVGHIDPYVATNQCVISGHGYSTNTTFGDSNNSSQFTPYATVLTFSNNVPSVSNTVYKASFSGVSGSGNNSDNNYNQRALVNGYLQSYRNTYGNEGTLWQKASTSSTVINEIRGMGGNSGNGQPSYLNSYKAFMHGNIAYTARNGFIDRWDLASGSYILENETVYGTQTNLQTTSLNNGITGHINSNGRMHTFSTGTSLLYYNVVTLGNVTGLYGVAKAAATSGNPVSMAVQGQTVDGYSNLIIGGGVGFNSAGTAIISSGTPRVGVAVAADEILIDTIGL